ncbi:MAG: radical SAM protein [Sedimentisphaerales bacterium]|nr:radical SAM protein [Sedimentisphaerales bacterium]
MSKNSSIKKIKFASIIVTYRCNARCHMCNIWKHPSEKSQEITPEIIDKLPAIPTFNITGGEPFLREDLNEILAVIKPKARRVVISTNGYWTERILEVARKNPWVGLRISMEGLPQANDQLRGIKDGFDHGLRTLIELNNMGIRDIGFGITVSDRNADDLLELYHLAKMLGVEFATAAVHNSYYFHKFDNRFESPEIAIRRLRQLVDELLSSRRPKDWFRAYFNQGLINYIQGNPRMLPCRMGSQAFFLDPYGEIRPCNVMEESLGNIKNSDFYDIWNSRQAQVVREKVGYCQHNCWMMGSVSEIMKKNISVPLKWVIKKKYLSAFMSKNDDK